MVYKLVLLGDGRVGKTSLVSRFVDDRFTDGEVSTVQAKMFIKKRVVVDQVPVEVAIWDTAGQERFHALGPMYYRGANGAVLVYDVTDTDSFDRVKRWIKELRQTVGPSIQLVICGNKCDLERERTVELDVAAAYAERQGAQHFSTSAKLNVGVQDAFEALVRAVLSEAGMLGGGPSPYGDDLGLGGGRDAKPKKRRGLKIDYNDSSAQRSAPDTNVESAPRLAGRDYDDGYDDEPAPAGGEPPRTIVLGGEKGTREKEKKKCPC
jgi:small GTP-binding protein